MKTIMLAAACLSVLTALSTAPPASAAMARDSAQTAGAQAADTQAADTQAARAAHPTPVAYDCLGWHRGQVKASTVALSCFGSVVVKVASWKYWSGISARSGAATLGVDNCKPNCGNGKFTKYAATVVLYRARSHDGVRYYSRLRVQYRHRGLRSYTYRWARYPGATIPVWVGGPSGPRS
jgi:hypothetical protein